jgi:N-methylhydantoinase A
MAVIVGVDVGGTFTDVVVVSDGAVSAHKVPTTKDQAEGVHRAVAALGPGTFLHGTTAATNTLLEGRGADVALLTDPGYEDLIEIGRQDRPALYDSSIDRPDPLVPRHRRHSDPSQVGDVEMVAISLLDSYLDPASEERLAASLGRDQVVLSSRISPEFREYERLATTVLSAYLTPSVAGYLRSLDERLHFETRLVMTSAGGLVPFAEAPGAAGRLVLSGPAGGVVASAALGSHHGHGSVITFDMGGTSTDVCRITDGSPLVGSGHRVAGRVNRVPSIPITTIGAGGGSVAWVDPGGALRVGPRSAGADPGPAVYGRGGLELTVTDANVLAGHIPPDLALGGSVHLDVEAGEAAAERLASHLGMRRDRLVAGVLEVIDAHMERALRAVSVGEGSDPRDSALVAFGGAGGLHATRLARQLGITTVLVPPHSGVFSALGLLLAAPRADAVRTAMAPVDDPSLGEVERQVGLTAGRRYVSMFGASPEHSTTSVDVRYRGQSHEIEIPVRSWSDVGADFHAAHRDRFGFDRPGQSIEAVNVRVTATGQAPLTWADLPPHFVTGSPVSHDGVWRRDTLPPGFEVSGPAIIVEENSATLVGQDERATVLGDGTLMIGL